ncbi:DUF896 domain-containing protein [Desemzia sp. FAM 23991]|uniref:DUF896 domain-containing protein n=1 Tax=unclassified Desemzia TaxID=2685243 RepID=UPI0038842994
MIRVLPRINELAKKARISGLTEEEKREQASLREQYLTVIRGSSKELLLSSTVVDILGNDVTPTKLKVAQGKLHIQAEWQKNPDSFYE